MNITVNIGIKTILLIAGMVLIIVAIIDLVKMKK